MLNSKKIILLLLIIMILQSIQANPFRNNRKEESVPVIRETSGSVSPFLIELQVKFRDKMALLLAQTKNNENSKAFQLLLLISFLYGMIHAAGPGHRKSVLFTVFLSNKSKWWEPGAAGILSASLHGLSGILLIVIFKEFSVRLLTSRVDLISKFMEAGSFFLLLFLGLLLIAMKLYKNSTDNEIGVNCRSFYYTVLLTSIFPCPGAILILVLSLSQNILYIGILSVISLSIGMGITISCTAYLGKTGRIGLFRILKSKEIMLAKLSDYLEITGYIFLIMFSFWMLYPVLFYN